MKLPLLCALSLAALTALAGHTANAAVVFSDDFNRDSTASPDGGLGGDWDISGDVFLNGNHALTQTGSTSFALYNEAALSESFTVSLDIYSQSNSRYVGVVFDYQDADNYYVLRASFEASKATSWQFLKIADGTQSTVDSGSVALGSMPLNTWRTLTVSSTGTPGQYSFSITSTDGQTTYASSLISDGTFAISGQAGLYFSNSFAWADNFSLTTVPEPSTWALMGAAGLLAFGFRRKNKVCRS